MIPIYLIYDNKGNRYGAYRSLKEARIENTLREKDELKDIELEIIYSR